MIPPSHYKPKREPIDLLGTILGVAIMICAAILAISALAALTAWLWRTIL